MAELEIPVQATEETVIEPVKTGWDSFKPIEQVINTEASRGTSAEVSETNAEQNQGTEVIQTPAFDETNWFKEKTGGKFEKWEDVEVLLNRPKEVEKPTFANETSKNIYEAILAGKEDELADYFGKKHFAKTLAAQPTEKVVKAYIKEQIPTLTENEVERYYQKNYGVDEESFSDEVDLSIAKKEAESKLEKVKGDALSYFNQKAESVQLPKIENPVENTNAGFDINNENNKSVIEFINSKAKQIGDEIPYEYVNNQNGANVKGKIPLDMKAISEYETSINGNVTAVIAARYFKNDDFDSKAFARDLWLLDHIAELPKIAAVTSYNEGYLAKIARDKNLKPDEQPNRTGDTPDTTGTIEAVKDYIWRGFKDPEFLSKKFGVSLDQADQLVRESRKGI